MAADGRYASAQRPSPSVAMARGRRRACAGDRRAVLAAAWWRMAAVVVRVVCLERWEV